MSSAKQIQHFLGSLLVCERSSFGFCEADSFLCSTVEGESEEEGGSRITVWESSESSDCGMLDLRRSWDEALLSSPLEDDTSDDCCRCGPRFC